MEIEAQGLTKAYHGNIALDHLSFKLAGEGLIGYLGPNGAGKTTTLKLFTNMIRPTVGRALVNGIEVSRDHVRALKNLAALIETPEPYPHQTIEEFLYFIAKIRGIGYDEAKQRIQSLSEDLSMESLSKRCGHLSKGHKQRVMLASALLADSEILLLDEPTSGLDPAEAHEVRVLLKNLKKDKLIFMSSHLLYEVTEVCDKVAFLNTGKLLLIDTVENVTKKFGSGAGVSGLEEAYVRMIREGL